MTLISPVPLTALHQTSQADLIKPAKCNRTHDNKTTQSARYVSHCCVLVKAVPFLLPTNTTCAFLCHLRSKQHFRIQKGGPDSPRRCRLRNPFARRTQQPCSTKMTCWCRPARWPCCTLPVPREISGWATSPKQCKQRHGVVCAVEKIDVNTSHNPSKEKNLLRCCQYVSSSTQVRVSISLVHQEIHSA